MSCLTTAVGLNSDHIIEEGALTPKSVNSGCVEPCYRENSAVQTVATCCACSKVVSQE